MKKVLQEIKRLQDSDVKTLIDRRMQEFYSFQKASDRSLFSELCFCLLTANWQAEGAIRIQKAMKDKFPTLRKEQLALELRKHGYRFPNVRAAFIEEAQQYKDNMQSMISQFKDQPDSSVALREWIVKNVKGLGFKEASHFLRNIGFDDLAIIDFHIIDLLEKDNIIERPKTVTPKKYLEIESVLKTIAKRTGLSLAELDLYLWYIETGKILK